MGFLGAKDLTAKVRDRCEKWVCQGRSVVPVIYRIRGGERVLVGSVQTESRRSEVFSNRLHGVVEVLSDSGGQAVRDLLGTVGHRP